MSDRNEKSHVSNRVLLYLSIVLTAMLIVTNFGQIRDVFQSNGLRAHTRWFENPGSLERLKLDSTGTLFERILGADQNVLKIELFNKSNTTYQQVSVEFREPWSRAVLIRMTGATDIDIVENSKPIQIGQVMPGDSIVVYIWARFALSFYHLDDELSIRHSSGFASVTNYEYAHWIFKAYSDNFWPYSICIALLLVVTGMLVLDIRGYMGYKASKAEIASPKEQQSVDPAKQPTRKKQA